MTQAEGALPTSEQIGDNVQVNISQNSFEEIMEAIRQEKNYQNITAEDVMRCLPRGLVVEAAAEVVVVGEAVGIGLGLGLFPMLTIH